MKLPVRLSVRARLTLWNTLVVALALTLFGIALRVGVARILRATVDRDLAQRFRGPLRRGEGPGQHHGGDGDGDHGGGMGRMDGMGGMGGPDDRGGGPGGPGGDAPPGSPPENAPSIGGANLDPRVLHLQNGVLSGRDKTPYSPDGWRRALRTRQPVYTTETTADHQTIRVLSRVISPPNDQGDSGGRNGNGESAVVQIPAVIDYIAVADRGVTTTLLLLIPAALLLTGVGGMALTNHALRPVDELGRLIGRIQAQNLKERLPDAGASDEFGRLSGVVNAMLGRLEGAFERQRRFAADASHELRTPLATIRASSSLALDPAMGASFTPEQYRSILARIDDAADRATRVTQDLLFLARVGALPIRHERLSLHGVLADAVASVQSAAQVTSTAATPKSAHDRRPLPEITLDVPEDLRVDSDRDHLLRLFINLIDNAARHTPPTGRVFLRAHCNGNSGNASNGSTGGSDTAAGATVLIADSGEGIAPEHLARLREPFYRPDDARGRRSGGAGLGLAISQGIVDALGGTLAIESLVGEGTTVTVTLPR